MNSIFSPEGCNEFLRRIDSLRPDSKAQWGKMNVSQMVAHCQAPLNVGLNEHPLGNYNFIIRTIGKMVKKGLVKDDKPFKRNQPTDKSFIMSDDKNFEVERSKLKDSLQRFSAAGREGKLLGKHPFFGPLSTKEWDLMGYKHLDHHLRQFGA